jgi:hypothetical protein
MKNVVSVMAILNFWGVAEDMYVSGIKRSNKLGRNWKFKNLRLRIKLEKL